MQQPEVPAARAWWQGAQDSPLPQSHVALPNDTRHAHASTAPQRAHSQVYADASYSAAHCRVVKRSDRPARASSQQPRQPLAGNRPRSGPLFRPTTAGPTVAQSGLASVRSSANDAFMYGTQTDGVLIGKRPVMETEMMYATMPADMQFSQSRFMTPRSSSQRLVLSSSARNRLIPQERV